MSRTGAKKHRTGVSAVSKTRSATASRTTAAASPTVAKRRSSSAATRLGPAPQPATKAPARRKHKVQQHSKMRDEDARLRVDAVAVQRIHEAKATLPQKATAPHRNKVSSTTIEATIAGFNAMVP